MTKFLTVLAGIILAVIALSFLGPIIALGIGVAITYYTIQSFRKSPTTLGKIWWGGLSLIGLHIILAAAPTLIGIVALVLLYYGYKQLKRGKTSRKTRPTAKTEDYKTDFSNFEKEWEEIMSKHKN